MAAEVIEELLARVDGRRRAAAEPTNRGQLQTAP